MRPGGAGGRAGGGGWLGPAGSWRAAGLPPRGDPAHETDRKILKKVLSRGIKIPYMYVPEKQSATTEIERQLRQLVVFPRQRPPSEHHSCAEVPVRRRDVRGVRLGPVAADPPSGHIRAWW
jgi:hypothetical protein